MNFIARMKLRSALSAIIILLYAVITRKTPSGFLVIAVFTLMYVGDLILRNRNNKTDHKDSDIG